MRTLFVLLIYLSATVVLAIILTPLVWPVGLTIWVLIALWSLLAVVRWHARNTVYRCPACGNEFSISSFTDFVSPHGVSEGGGWKLLTCPRCGRYVKASAQSRERQSSEDRNKEISVLGNTTRVWRTLM